MFRRCIAQVVQASVQFYMVNRLVRDRDTLTEVGKLDRHQFGQRTGAQGRLAAAKMFGGTGMHSKADPVSGREPSAMQHRFGITGMPATGNVGGPDRSK